MSATISLRPAQPADLPFQLELYASTRITELAQTGWSPDEVRAFLESQFAAQTRHYTRFYPQAETSIVLEEGQVPIGRMIVDRSGDGLLLMDIALLPEARGRGTGTGLVRALLAEAEQKGQPVSLHVELFNPAQRLYARLGFKVVSSEGIYARMEWQPAAAEPAGQPEGAG